MKMTQGLQLKHETQIFNKQGLRRATQSFMSRNQNGIGFNECTELRAQKQRTRLPSPSHIKTDFDLIKISTTQD